MQQPGLTTLSNRHIQNLAQDCNKPLWSKELSTNSDSQNKNHLNIHPHSSMWDPLICHPPLTAIKESTDLSKGITGTTIGKKVNRERQYASVMENIQNTTRDTIPELIKGNGRRNNQSDNVKIKITIKNRLIRGHGNGSNKGEPLECFKVTSLKGKKHN